ncbi:conserved hypothetical protein [Magnetococcus marinus MC-1]|uniref:Uncharacterized protein n=1 Tax=Magnetococcus marinus (strain ATCC BAA-1437 / JCM 17883 / MC-1) TaxID=156889 RepID=A0LDW9_MAGMM|nr:hypothetical protein [Magnetococcus marinus]ABK46162.1 conserved hypothetical protein [Magnetococcus marinus MC-1]
MDWMISNMRATALTLAKTQLTSLVLAVLICLISFTSWLSDQPQTAFDQLALGKDVTEVSQQEEGYHVHCRTLNDGGQCLHDWLERGAKPVHVWLGNSQLHAINQWQPGETTAPNVLHQRWKDGNHTLLAYSQPNANLMEHYLLFEALLEKLPVERLILPVVFDDLRETGIRPTLLPLLSQPSIVSNLSNTSIGQKIIAQNTQVEKQSEIDLKGLSETPQKRVESYLNHQLSHYWPWWDKRVEARGQIYFFLYRLRNQVFGITAQSKRKIIRARYLDNMAALDAILVRAKQRFVDILLYIPPIRNDVELPYLMREYTSFKHSLSEKAQGPHIHLFNFENLVPAHWWGANNSTNMQDKTELDFMHFQGPGHVRLAQAIDEAVKTMDKGVSR